MMKAHLMVALAAGATLGVGAPFCVAAQDATRWRRVATDGMITAWQDKQPPVQLGGLRLAWTLWDYPKHPEVFGNDSVKSFRRMTRSQFDCKQLRTKLVAAITYDSTLHIIRSQDFEPEYLAWSAVIPNSIGEMLLADVCRVSKP